MKASVAHRAVATKCQVHEVGSALNLLRKFTVLEAANQMGAAVWPIVDVQEIIVWLNTEAVTSKRKKQIKDKTVIVLPSLNHQIVQIERFRMQLGLKMKVCTAMLEVSHAKRFVLHLQTKR